MRATPEVSSHYGSWGVSCDMFLYIFEGAQHAGGVSYWIGVEGEWGNSHHQ